MSPLEKFRMPRHAFILIALLAAMPARAASYEAELDPAPFDAGNRADVIGSIGSITANLDGGTLTVSGTFSGMTSAPTGASVRIGLAKGVPGGVVGPLNASQDGKLSGSVKLSGAQVAALKKQALYIRIDSVKAPDGNLQGWLEETASN
jgi:CHRD domain